MKSRIADLRCKEIINVTDGSRYGYVGDVEVDLDSGRVCALVVPGRLRLFGLLGREADRIFPWNRCGGLGRTSSWWSPARCGPAERNAAGADGRDRKKSCKIRIL